MGQGTTGRFPLTRLLDINVLLAIAWPQHFHYQKVNHWIEEEKIRGPIPVATSPITQLGFLRISMNIKGYAQDFENAANLLQVLLRRGEFQHEFWSDDQPALALAGLASANIGAAQLTDFYLVHLAKSHGGRLLTLDTGIKDASVEVIN